MGTLNTTRLYPIQSVAGVRQLQTRQHRVHQAPSREAPASPRTRCDREVSKPAHLHPCLFCAQMLSWVTAIRASLGKFLSPCLLAEGFAMTKAEPRGQRSHM